MVPEEGDRIFDAARDRHPTSCGLRGVAHQSFDTGADVCFGRKDGIGSKQNGHRYRRDGCCGRESRTLQGTGIHQE
jgi:hypothetical protein